MWHMLPRVLFGLLNVWSLLSGKGVLVHVPELETFSLCCPFKVIPKRRTRKNNIYIYNMQHDNYMVPVPFLLSA